MARNEPTEAEELYMKIVSGLSNEFSEREMLFVLEVLDKTFNEVLEEDIFTE